MVDMIYLISRGQVIFRKVSLEHFLGTADRNAWLEIVYKSCI
jgi:hypothetical protein